MNELSLNQSMNSTSPRKVVYNSEVAIQLCFIFYLTLITSLMFPHIYGYVSSGGITAPLTYSQLHQTSGIPFDVIRYNRQAYLFSEAIRDPSTDTGNVFLLNWTGLGYAGGLLRVAFGNAYVFIVTALNIFFLHRTWMNYRSVMPNGDAAVRALPMLLFAIPPFVGSYVFGLNKECISLYVLSSLVRTVVATGKIDFFSVFLITFSRTHLLACIIAALRPRRQLISAALFVVAISLVYPFFRLGADFESYYLNQSSNIRSQEMYRIIEQVKHVPLGYCLALPFLIMLNVVTPIYTAISRLSQGYGNLYLYYLLFGLQIIVCAVMLLKRRSASKVDFLILIFVAVVLTTPFLQPRYLLPIVPCVYFASLGGKARRYTPAYSGSASSTR